MIGKRQAATLDTPLSLQLDTTCMRAPNFISVNGDEINDRFVVLHYEPLQFFSLTIINPNGNSIYSATTEQAGWSGYDAEFADQAGPIPYLYTVQVTTMSGSTHSTSKVLHVIRDIYNECITSDVAPVAGDQYDPRRLCDLLYPTNDFVCVQ